MKLGVLIPTRGDRAKFLSQAKNLLSKQTLKPDEINIVDFKPSDEKKISQKDTELDANNYSMRKNVI
jgi:hypothetical protein